MKHKIVPSGVQEMEPRNRKPRTEAPKKAAPAPKVPSTAWVEGYMADMGQLQADQIPTDWIDCAKYHLSGVSNRVTNIEVLDWNPTHVDVEHRLIDQASLWCGAKIDGKPYGIIIHLHGPSVKMEYVAGAAKDMESPF